ncbi:hypothetical protein PVAP13_6KG171800 [Panicum virgatum]|uniref:Uncharacterized protein n=1 Tax=Panicum virgatum TaxID=38727 RepID=A0A8T0R724_PANVG|nr:hypothetical protein PVAP13_6KG171800 [Panicum virgatum]
MAATPADGREVSITVVPPTESSEEQQRESISADIVEGKLKTLNRVVFCVAFWEWAGNAVGTLAFLWATVVLLGGFSSLLSRMDFWFATVMIFVEGSRVFIRNDASVNQWLFGSTSAFRWENLSSSDVLAENVVGKTFAVITGVALSLTPIEFRPELVAGILKVAILVIISQLLTQKSKTWYAKAILVLLVAASVIGGIVGSFKLSLRYIMISKKNPMVPYYLKISVLLTAWQLGTFILMVLAIAIVLCIPLRGTLPKLCFKVIIASGLACLPFLQAALASYYRYVSISIALMLLTFSYHEILRGVVFAEVTLDEQNNSSCGLLLPILDETVMPILFFWSVMFPLPGISLKISFYMLFSVIAALLIANLQIPVAFLQVLLSILRLRTLLGHHRHHDYRPLPPDASPNLVPSIVIFFMMELCQGSSYILATICGLISLFRRRSLARDLKLEGEWGAEAVNLYCRQAYQARMEKGLLPSEKSKPSLSNLAIKPLGSTSSETQIAGLRVLENFLGRLDSKSKKDLITEITDASKETVPTLIGMLCSTVGGDEDISLVLRSPLNFVRRLAIDHGKIGARFRQELSKNPFLLNSLGRIMDGDCQPELWAPVVDIITALALEEAARQEIGSTQSIIPKLMHAFVRPDDVNNPSNDRSLRKAAGKALANLTMKSTDNCWAILLEKQGHNLIKKLIDMLDDEYYICAVANLLHNLCANSRDKLMEIDLCASVQLESALTKVMRIIMTSKEGKQLEAALCVTSHIGYVIPKCFRKVLISDTDAAALVEKLVDTLNSNKEPRPEYPRIRRVLVEVVISIVRLCPDPYRTIFREKKAKDALDMVKGTPSRLERYRVFINGEGVLPESLPMRGLVDKAKKLIYRPTPTTSAEQAGEHA